MARPPISIPTGEADVLPTERSTHKAYPLDIPLTRVALWLPVPFRKTSPVMLVTHPSPLLFMLGVH